MKSKKSEIQLRPQRPFSRIESDSYEQLSFHFDKMCDTKEFCPKKRIYPITSYGIIAFTREEKPRESHSTNNIRSYDNRIRDNGIIKYLIYQRRDNYEYIEFIRGNWISYEQLKKFFSLMSEDERERIRTHTHKQLWDDLWLDHNSKVYKEGYDRAKSQYENIVRDIPKLLETTTTYMEDCPWGFPKGKINTGESFIECAKREFEEETRIPRENLSIVKDIRYPGRDSKKPYIEQFEGSNNKIYCTHYYLAHINNEILPEQKETPSFCIRKTTISTEASDLKWITIDEAPKYLNARRVDILERANAYIKKYIYVT
jgi:8-oxo-dGTP pyrophosphatase MutT (NUDIX family)